MWNSVGYEREMADGASANPVSIVVSEYALAIADKRNEPASTGSCRSLKLAGFGFIDRFGGIHESTTEFMFKFFGSHSVSCW
jgi:hypothetical protein